MVREFTKGDRGKNIMNSKGDKLGTVADTESGMLHVKPATSLTRRMRQRLGWESDDEAFIISQEHVEKIRGNEIHLKKSPAKR